MTRRLPVLLLLALLCAIALAACGSSDGGTTTVVTVVEKQAASDTSDAGSSDAPDTSTSSSAGSDTSEEADSIVSDEGTGGNSEGGRITVPDEVGKNHQAAQDDLQAHGLYNLAEEDATGQGRMLVWDRNWVVVSQSPAPGRKVPEDTTITLRSKKYTD